MSKTKSFIEQCIAGEALTDDVEDFIEKWHERSGTDELHEYLGMNWREYSLWLTEPDILPQIIVAHRDKVPLARLIRDTQTYAVAARFEGPKQTKKILAWLKQHGKLK